jgi:hypothetical protein
VTLKCSKHPMMRISIPWLFDIMESLDGLDKVEADHTVLDEFVALYGVQSAIERAYGQSVYVHYLRASRQSADHLYTAIRGLLDAPDWAEKKLSIYEVQGIKFQKDRLKTVLLADMSALPSYLVTPKGNFDVIFLIDAGINLFPPSLEAKAPETKDDAKEVGRSLAFELATACGFHTFRVTESVVRRYWDQVSSGAERPKLQTLGSFAGQMEEKKIGDAKVVESIKQMTKLHRNPLIHPEVILTPEEAIGIIGMARSVIASMLQVLPDVPPTTGAAPTLEAPSS